MPELRTYTPGEIVGTYEVIVLVDVGGLGAIYKVKKGDDVFAMKVPRIRASGLSGREWKQSAARLAREFHTLWNIRHPYIVRAYDFGWHQGSPFYTMELLEGLPLPEYIDHDRPRLRDALNAFLGVTQAVAHLHDQGICHRDLKPSNIFIRLNGKPVLLDFGICQPLLAPTITGPGELVGTTQYLSPEYAAYVLDGNAERHVCAPAEDVHALGVILYELLTGRPPYRSRTGRREELLTAIRREAPVHPCEVLASTPQSLADLAMRLLAKDPAQRPQDAGAVLEVLVPALREAQPYLWGPAPERDAPPSLQTVSSSELRASVKTRALGPPPSEWTVPLAPHRRAPRRRPGYTMMAPLLVLAGWAFLALPHGGSSPASRSPWASERWELPPPPPSPVCPDAPPEPLSFSSSVTLQKGTHPVQPTRSTHSSPRWFPPHDGERRSPLRFVWGAAAGACLAAGCATVPLLPNGMAACAPEASAATGEMAIPSERWFFVTIMSGIRGRTLADPFYHRDGPIEVRLEGDVNGHTTAATWYDPDCQAPPTDTPGRIIVPPAKCYGPILLPDASRLLGEARTQGDRMQARFHKLVLPNGRTLPFCGYIFYHLDRKPGVPVNMPEALKKLGIERPPPGMVVIQDEGVFRIRAVGEMPTPP